MNELPEDVTSNGSPGLETLDYLHGVKSSTCLLLPTTPSPTAMDFKHPLSEEAVDAPFLTLNDEPSMDVMENSDVSAGDSSSSADSNSVIQDPVSAQLINNISMLDYQTLSKNGDLILGEVQNCKLNGHGNNISSNRKLPSFINWNWSIIRKVLLWVVLTGLVACIAAIVAMIITIPKECNPSLPWYQGKVFYEVFPATFKDSDSDGTGDFKGLISKLDYIHNLGVSAIRLNSIFDSSEYPDKFYNISSFLNVHRSLGTIKDFQNLVSAVHNRNMSLILDLPVNAVANPVTVSNLTQTVLLTNDSLIGYSDQTTAAIQFWAWKQNVDGFYLKHLEKFVDDPNFGKSLQFWKRIIGIEKILIASEKAYKNAKDDALNILLSRIDLIDIHLDLSFGVEGLKTRINEVVGGFLWSKPHYPWVHWNVGNVDNDDRISTKHINNTLVLMALEFILPGTVSIFYGDEIGLGQVPDQKVETDFHEHMPIPNLVHMTFSINDKNKLRVLPWNSGSVLEPKYHYLDIIKSFISLRLETPTIYLRAIYKEGNILKNMEIRKTTASTEDLVVIERWYPRRNTCVFVGNLSNRSITTDLSTMFYGGTVVAGTNTSIIGQVLYFDQVTFPPNSAIILKLEK